MQELEAVVQLMSDSQPKTRTDPSTRLNFRPNAYDVVAIEQVIEWSSGRVTKTDTIEAALHLAVLVQRDGGISLWRNGFSSREEKALVAEYPTILNRVAIPKFIHIRKNKQINEYLEYLSDRKFGNTETLIVRRSILLLWSLAWRLSSGWSAGRKSSLPSFDVERDIGISIRQIDSEVAFSTTPTLPLGAGVTL